MAEAEDRIRDRRAFRGKRAVEPAQGRTRPAVNIDPRAHDDIAALPVGALNPLAEAITVLPLTPWNAAPIDPDNPSGLVRTLAFGDAGLATVLQERVA